MVTVDSCWNGEETTGSDFTASKSCDLNRIGGGLNLRGELYCFAACLLGSEWRLHLQEIESSAPGEIEQRSLSELLNCALTNVPYYRELGVLEPRLDAFPLLARQTLRTQFERLKSDDLESRRWSRASTGGSTGEPVWVIQDQGFLRWDHATDMYYMNAFHGTPYHEYLRSRRVAIWHHRRRRTGTGLLKHLVVRMLGQLIYVEPYAILSEERMTEYLQRINRHRPAVILAFAGTIFELARHAKRLGIRVHIPRFILCSVEMLFAPMREMIEEVFGCPVYNMYGAAEVGWIAAECPAGKLHVFSFNNRVEVLNPDGSPTAPGGIGRVVVTPLHNLAMPLIRYDIGDLARVTSQPCSCGSPLPMLAEIEGRIVHHFVRPDGSLVFGGNFIAMFYEHDWITQFHVLQVDVDQIRIIYTRTPGSLVPEDALDILSRAVRGAMGEGCTIAWEEVDVIPKSPAGKHLHARSLVWEERTGIAGRNATWEGERR